ncbi:MAG: FlgO family outer membrane protein [Desulfovibrionaceae bacterium]
MAQRPFRARPRPLPLWPLVLAALLLAWGCSSPWTKIKRGYDASVDAVFDIRPTASPLYAEDQTSLVDLNYEAAGDMIHTLKKSLPRSSPLYVERFANLGDPKDPSPFGQVVAEQVAARLVQDGYLVTAGAPAAPDEAELADKTPEEPALANNPLASSPPRPSLLAGHYLIGDDVIYCSATVTALDTDTLVAAWDWTLPVNDNTRALLPQLRKTDGPEPNVRTQF